MGANRQHGRVGRLLIASLSPSHPVRLADDGVAGASETQNSRDLRGGTAFDLIEALGEGKAGRGPSSHFAALWKVQLPAMRIHGAAADTVSGGQLGDRNASAPFGTELALFVSGL
jgi:hypothetical protein